MAGGQLPLRGSGVPLARVPGLVLTVWLVDLAVLFPTGWPFERRLCSPRASVKVRSVPRESAIWS
jgi:hypothetical protein